MCYSVRQKYEECGFFRQHYVYRDIKCAEMTMWSDFYKKNLWCRRILEHGTTAFADESHHIATIHFPSPPPEVEVPLPLTCHHCNPSLREPAKALSAGSDEKPARPELVISTRQPLSVQMSKTFSAITSVVPSDLAYSLIRMFARGKPQKW